MSGTDAGPDLAGRPGSPAVSAPAPAASDSAASDSASNDSASNDPGERSLAERSAEAFEAYRRGDRDRMADLVTAVSPILWHTVRSYRLDTQAAEDVVQSTWLALVRRADTVHDPRAVLQWLIVTARREAWRVAGAQRRVDPTDFEGEQLVAPAGDEPEARTVRGARDDQLWRAVGQLSQRCQRLLRVVAFADRPDYAAVSQALGMPIGSIGPTRGRCLAQLRAALGPDRGVWTS